MKIYNEDIYFHEKKGLYMKIHTINVEFHG